MVPSHLRGRRRDRENGWYHATEENEFFPVHNVVGFLKIKPGGIRKLRPATVRKGNAVVTFPMRAKAWARLESIRGKRFGNLRESVIL